MICSRDKNRELRFESKRVFTCVIVDDGRGVYVLVSPRIRKVSVIYHDLDISARPKFLSARLRIRSVLLVRKVIVSCSCMDMFLCVVDEEVTKESKEELSSALKVEREVVRSMSLGGTHFLLV